MNTVKKSSVGQPPHDVHNLQDRTVFAGFCVCMCLFFNVDLCGHVLPAGGRDDDTDTAIVFVDVKFVHMSNFSTTCQLMLKQSSRIHH